METVNCAVCCYTMKNPITLSCQHSYCKECISTHTEFQRKEFKTPACPTCRKKIDIDIKSVPKNCLLEELIELFTGQFALFEKKMKVESMDTQIKKPGSQKLEIKVPCKLCKAPVSKDNYFSIDIHCKCKKTVCEYCFRLLSERIKDHHIKDCADGYELCNGCKEYIPRKELHTHKLTMCS